MLFLGARPAQSDVGLQRHHIPATVPTYSTALYVVRSAVSCTVDYGRFSGRKRIVRPIEVGSAASLFFGKVKQSDPTASGWLTPTVRY